MHVGKEKKRAIQTKNGLNQDTENKNHKQTNQSAKINKPKHIPLERFQFEYEFS